MLKNVLHSYQKKKVGGLMVGGDILELQKDIEKINSRTSLIQEFAMPETHCTQLSPKKVK